MERLDTVFTSGGEQCAAWHYRPDAGDGRTCVVMANGFSLTRHDGLPHVAERLAAAGAQALVFDHRYLGDSGGQPRQRFRTAEQHEDWRNAIAHAKGLEGVRNIVLWGFSFSGGHCVALASRRDDLAAVLVLAPMVDGLARALGTPPSLMPWILPKAVADLAGRHNLVPVTAQPGEKGAMNLPGEADGFARSVQPDSPWRNEISPGVFATVGLFRPFRRASKVTCPMWVGLGERDISVSAKAVETLAMGAPQAELRRYPWDHFDPLLPENAAKVGDDQAAFLRSKGLV